MAVRVTNKRGKEITLLSPREKGHKFAAELQSKLRFTNDGEVKMKNGIVQTLSKEQAAFRSGYLQARKDIGKAYNARQRKNAGVLLLPYDGNKGSN